MSESELMVSYRLAFARVQALEARLQDADRLAEEVKRIAGPLAPPRERLPIETLAGYWEGTARGLAGIAEDALAAYRSNSSAPAPVLPTIASELIPSVGKSAAPAAEQHTCPKCHPTWGDGDHAEATPAPAGGEAHPQEREYRHDSLALGGQQTARPAADREVGTGPDETWGDNCPRCGQALPKQALLDPNELVTLGKIARDLRAALAVSSSGTGAREAGTVKLTRRTLAGTKDYFEGRAAALEEAAKLVLSLAEPSPPGLDTGFIHRRGVLSQIAEAIRALSRRSLSASGEASEP